MNRLRRFPERSATDLQLEARDVRYLQPSLWLPELQRVLRPGAHADILDDGPGASRRLRQLGREARHYFDVQRVAAAAGGAVRLRVRRRPTRDATQHFEALAPHYWDEIPPHVQAHFLGKKLALLRRFLPALEGRRVLDLGCGVGRYAEAAQRQSGAQVVGVDPSRAAVRDARRHAGASGPAFLAGDALRLPFRDGIFDAAYTINVIHHLKRGEQERALSEVRRVLRPGARLIVHEMNVRNTVLHWYLRHVYPRLRHIDRGDEEFLHPSRWPISRGWRLVALEYMTFVPDFAPRWTLGGLRRLEARLERGRAARYAVHYAVVLERTDQ